MSIEKIGKTDQGVSIDLFRQTSQIQQQKPGVSAGNDQLAAVYEPSVKGNTEKVNYPPFFPVGDTQSIYEK